MDVPFTKMHGLGNDFMVIDNRSDSYDLTTDVIRKWSDRNTGIGFDQLLMVQEPSVEGALFNYRIFNADGDEVEHCGNGARCFARYVTDRKMTTETSIPVNTQAGIITLRLQDNNEVTVEMGVPNFTPDDIPLLVDAKTKTETERLISAEQHKQYQLLLSAGSASGSVSGITTNSNSIVTERFANLSDTEHLKNHPIHFGSVSIGNPHAVLWVDDLNSTPVKELGSQLERHSVFPQRVNVGFMQLLTDAEVQLRVFERGVGETKSCGTGACAAVAIGIQQGILQREVAVNLQGGKLKIVWSENHKSIEMTGPCSTVFEGQTRM